MVDASITQTIRDRDYYDSIESAVLAYFRRTLLKLHLFSYEDISKEDAQNDADWLLSGDIVSYDW